MRTDQNAVLDSLVRAQQFLAMHGESLPGVLPSTRTQLADAITELSALAVTQDTGARGSRGETSRQRALRLALRRNHMTPVAAVAKLMLRDVPEFSALKLPPVHGSVRTAVSAAYAMANAAEAHAQTLMDNGLSATFIADLRSAAAQVNESLNDRIQHQGRRTGATAGLVAGEKRGRAVLGVLDAVIKGHIGHNEPLLAEWTAARHLRRKSGTPKGSQASDPAPLHQVVVVPASSTVTPKPVPVLPPIAVAA